MKRGVGKKKNNLKAINNILLVVLIVEMIFLLAIVIAPQVIAPISGKSIATNGEGNSLSAFIVLIVLIIAIIAVFILRSLKKH